MQPDENRANLIATALPSGPQMPTEYLAEQSIEALHQSALDYVTSGRIANIYVTDSEELSLSVSH